MSKVLKTNKLINIYLDQIDERNSVEKDRFNIVFTDYTRAMKEIKDLNDKLKVKERENY